MINKSDMMYRIGDLILFVFIGIPFILFWVFIDQIYYVFGLFSTQIMHIDEYHEENQIKINKQMDGSLERINTVGDKVKNKPLSGVPTQPIFKSNPSSKGLNPIKEGLSDTTLLIVKACCRMLLDSHQIDIEQSKYGNEIKHSFVPTVSILEKMRENLLVQQQINTILFGESYRKSQEFFKSENYSLLVESLAESDQGPNIIDNIFNDASIQFENENEEWIKKQKTSINELPRESCKICQYNL